MKETWNVFMKGEQNFLHGMIKNKKGSDEQVASTTKISRLQIPFVTVYENRGLFFIVIVHARNDGLIGVCAQFDSADEPNQRLSETLKRN